MELKDRIDEIDRRIERLLLSQEKTDEEIRNLSKEVDKLSKEVDKVSKEVGKVSDGLGRFAEGLVGPSVSKLFLPLGISIFNIFPRARAMEDGRCKAEIDLLCPGVKDGKKVTLVGEVKTRLTSEYVRDFLKRLLDFKGIFTDYKDSEIIGFVAGMQIDESAKDYAEREGLYVLGPAEDTMQILNRPGFTPKIW